jgi:MOSC domain-containing protein YiiM
MTARLQSPLKALMLQFPREGKLEWIGLRPAYRAPVTPTIEAQAIADHGLAGDHASDRSGGRRQITLIQWEHLNVIAQLLERDGIDPSWLRRNLVISGVNLLALRQCTFMVGEAMLAGTGVCAPCSRMEAALGVGGFNAMRGHGGITARIIEGGMLRVGDTVRWRSTAQEQTDLL